MIGIKPEKGQRLIDGEGLQGVSDGQNFGYANGLTARSGGGQANATPLPIKRLIGIATVAVADDSVALPISDAGMILSVINTSANELAVYASPLANRNNGGATDKINGAANNVLYAIAPGAVATFHCAKAGSWYALKSA